MPNRAARPLDGVAIRHLLSGRAVGSGGGCRRVSAWRRTPPGVAWQAATVAQPARRLRAVSSCRRAKPRSHQRGSPGRAIIPGYDDLPGMANPASRGKLTGGHAAASMRRIRGAGSAECTKAGRS
jgi:hypothetical protein